MKPMTQKHDAGSDTFPKITVIIPVYNVAPYLQKCLDSVMNQTYANLEIIIVDDGSTDGGGAICDRYAGEDERIQVIHQENQGLSAARNAALDIMTGELVGFVDSDDWIETDFYERLEKGMEEYGADISVIGFYNVYQNGRYPSQYHVENKVLEKTEGMAALEQGGIGHAVWNKLYRREAWRKVRFPVGRVFEDVLTTWKLFLKAKRVVCVEGYGYNHIIRKGSICNTPTLRHQSFAAHLELYQRLEKLEHMGKIEKGVSTFFLPGTVTTAYFMAYRYRGRADETDVRRAKIFWKRNRKAIAELGIKYWLVSHFPRMAAVWIAIRSAIAVWIRFMGHKKLFE